VGELLAAKDIAGSVYGAGRGLKVIVDLDSSVGILNASDLKV
jgi:hypothetical protein